MTGHTTALTDTQREAAITQLREAVGSGQLTLAEFDQRAMRVYAATSPTELAPLVADVPTPTRSKPAKAGGYQLALRIEWLAWLGAGLINLAIWAAVSAGMGAAIYFWPVWVIGPWGLVLLGRELADRSGIFAASSIRVGRTHRPRRRCRLAMTS